MAKTLEIKPIFFSLPKINGNIVKNKQKNSLHWFYFTFDKKNRTLSLLKRG